MSWNICAMTGNQLEDPVVSKKTGHIFERKLIEKHIDATGQCPITSQPLTLEDILPIQINKIIKPRPINANSVPNMLTLLQSEWDAIMLETYTLKQHLETVRQELSHALYQHDAACRVIARLIKERDEARIEVSKMMERMAKKEEMIEEIDGNENRKLYLPEKVTQEISETALNLNALRKERKKNPNYFSEYPSIELISNFQTKTSVPLHSASKPGISCMDIHPNLDNLIITGGFDSNAIIYDRLKSQIISTVEKHTKKINEIVFIPEIDPLKFITCGEDSKANLITYNLETKEIKNPYVIDQHNGPITGCSIHPIGYLAACCSKDGTWSFHDLNEGKLFNKVQEFGKGISFGSIGFHPDGHILASGASDGTIKIWNDTEDSLVATLEGHQNLVDKICFSENGFYFASCSSTEGVVKLWDLRKLKTIKTFFDEGKNKIGSVNFDKSGQYLSIAESNSIYLYSTKTLEMFATFDSHKDFVTSAKFGKESKFLVSTSLDRHLTIYSN